MDEDQRGGERGNRESAMYRVRGGVGRIVAKSEE